MNWDNGEAKQLISCQRSQSGISTDVAVASDKNDKAKQVNEFINIYLSSFFFIFFPIQNLESVKWPRLARGRRTGRWRDMVVYVQCPVKMIWYTMWNGVGYTLCAGCVDTTYNTVYRECKVSDCARNSTLALIGATNLILLVSHSLDRYPQ